MLILPILYIVPLFIIGTRAHPASPLTLAVVKEQFKNAKIVPDIIASFDPIGVTSFNYSSFPNKTTVGLPLSRDATATAPIHVYIRGTEDAEATAGGPFNVTNWLYTVILVDGRQPGYQNSSGYTLHWLSNNWTYGENDDHTVTLNPPSGSVVAYAGPAPPSGTGPHRYISLVYAQPSDFKVPSTPAVGSGPVLFDLEKYKTESGLGKAIAGTYFTVEEGTATISIAATQPVDSTTLPQYTPTSTGGAVAGARILKEVGLALAGGLLLI